MMLVRPNTAAANTSQAFSSMSLCPNEFMIVMLEADPGHVESLSGVMAGLVPAIHALLC
jgi:hypothetical protein